MCLYYLVAATCQQCWVANHVFHIISTVLLKHLLLLLLLLLMSQGQAACDYPG